MSGVAGVLTMKLSSSSRLFEKSSIDMSPSVELDRNFSGH